jgi:uncharacterized protein
MLKLAVELILLFLLLPLAYRFSPVSLPPFPILWVVTLYCYLHLRKMPGYSFSQSWNIDALPQQLPTILLPFLCFAALAAIAVWRFAPDSLFILVRHRPWLWFLIMLLYPLLSAFPQNLIYRAFLMARYQGLIASPAALILVSAAAFSFMHIIFRNPIAVILTFFGGVLFAWRYQHSGSLAASTLEHALYGCLLFTLGLGEYFYHGRIALR